MTYWDQPEFFIGDKLVIHVWGFHRLSKAQERDAKTPCTVLSCEILSQNGKPLFPPVSMALGFWHDKIEAKTGLRAERNGADETILIGEHPLAKALLTNYLTVILESTATLDRSPYFFFHTAEVGELLPAPKGGYLPTPLQQPVREEQTHPVRDEGTWRRWVSRHLPDYLKR